jgi:hypothetical protein
MDPVSKKRKVSLVPKQMKDPRVGKWDEHGGVFTQENPRPSQCKLMLLCFMLSYNFDLGDSFVFYVVLLCRL